MDARQQEGVLVGVGPGKYTSSYDWRLQPTKVRLRSTEERLKYKMPMS